MAMAPMMMPRGPAGPPAPPVLPKSPIGAPGGPGASPMVSPGNNAGQQASAKAKINAITESLKPLLVQWPTDSEEFRAISDAIRTLSKRFGKSGANDLTPAARRQIAQAPKPPLAGSPPPGLGGGPRPPMMPPAAAMPGAGGQGPPEV